MAKWSQDAKFKPSVPEFKSSSLVSIFLLFTDGSDFNFSDPLLNSGAGLLPASGDSYISVFLFCFFFICDICFICLFNLNLKIPSAERSDINICLMSPINLWTRLSCFADVDECELRTDICNGNAFCTNNVGLYDCSCMDGYTGDGFDCRGNTILYDW